MHGAKRTGQGDGAGVQTVLTVLLSLLLLGLLLGLDGGGVLSLGGQLDVLLGLGGLLGHGGGLSDLAGVTLVLEHNTGVGGGHQQQGGGGGAQSDLSGLGDSDCWERGRWSWRGQDV